MRRRPKILTTFHVSYRCMAGSVRPYTLEGRRFGGDFRTLLYRFGTCTVHHWMDRIAARLSDTVNAISRQSAIETVGDPDRAEIIYYGLPPLPPDHHVAEPVELLYAGAPGHRKRVLALPFVLERVRREIPGARLRIIGFDLDARPKLRALFAEKGLLPHVECLGRRVSGELPPHYRAAGVVLVPSAYEGLPFVILEAMQCGAAVVATRVSGHPEAIEDGANGFLVDLDDTAAMADRCVRLLKDSALRARIGRAARVTIADRFTLEQHLAGYLDLYRHLAGEGRP
jgi:glycosyltransferase involved in cell wall biosynthesis